MCKLLQSLIFVVLFSIVNISGTQINYKVHIDARKEDCYFQYVDAGADFYVYFQVLRGGDGKAGLALRNPEGTLVHPYQWLSESAYQEHVKNPGYYSICIDNTFSKFAPKLVNIYISAIRYDEWTKYSKELEDLNMSVESFTSSITHVDKNIKEMIQSQYLSSSREAKDLNLLLDNNNYVQMWSLAQIVVIVVSTTAQVYTVRRMFEVKPSKYSRMGI